MIVAQLDGIARATCGAVKKVLAPTHTTDAAFLAVELMLAQVVVVQVADGTKVCTKASSVQSDPIENTPKVQSLTKNLRTGLTSDSVAGPMYSRQHAAYHRSDPAFKAHKSAGRMSVTI